MHLVNDIVFSAGVGRLSAIEQSNLSVAHRLEKFSLSHPLPEEAGGADMPSNAEAVEFPDMGVCLVTLTQNSLAYTMVSRALSSQLGLYSLVISEGKNT